MDDDVAQKDCQAVVPELPLELILKIIDYIPKEPQVRTECTDHAGQWSVQWRYAYALPRPQGTLAKLSRVCRRWREAVVPLLFHAPRITSLREAEQLHACLEARKDFGGMVHSLSWTFPCYLGEWTIPRMAYLPRNLLHLCPNMEELIFWFFEPQTGQLTEQFLDAIFRCRHHPLKKLALNNFWRKPDQYFAKLPSSFPLLERLDLIDTAIRLETTLMLFRECKHLTELVLETENSEYIDEDIAEIERARPPNLLIRYMSSDLLSLIS
ncbi:hypothetical protein DFS34DRAFT_697307 [Phlyctochytrium arcticum]|nr:hypothetical protein DFS34DRAFT_697307 [Phlyctochytrium arcticum]